MSVKAADDYDYIHHRLTELKLERERAAKRCKGGCGQPIGNLHQNCMYSGMVLENETA